MFESFRAALPAFHLSPSQQNLQEEFESAVFIISWIEGTDPASKRIKDGCTARINQLEARIHSPLAMLAEFANFLDLFWIMQQFLLVGPHEQVRIQFFRLRDNLAGVPIDERKNWTQSEIDFLDQAMTTPSAPMSPPREKLYALRKFLDDRIAVAIWQSCFSKICLLFLGPLLLALTIILAVALGQDNLQFTGVWFTIAFTITGAILSCLLGCFSAPAYKGPPGMNEYAKVICRPIIGLVAGLFLFALVHSNIINGDRPAAIYAAAVAFGFSERLFIGILEQYGDGISKKLGERAP
jgi:hypothetical protein